MVQRQLLQRRIALSAAAAKAATLAGELHSSGKSRRRAEVPASAEAAPTEEAEEEEDARISRRLAGLYVKRGFVVITTDELSEARFPLYGQLR